GLGARRPGARRVLPGRTARFHPGSGVGAPRSGDARRDRSRRGADVSVAAGRRVTLSCPFCATLNRVDLARVAARPKCGPCARRRGRAADGRGAAGPDRCPAGGGAAVSGEVPLVSERSRGVALALSVLGGVFGLHRFYVGRNRSGVWMCVTLGGLGIWYLYDV